MEPVREGAGGGDLQPELSYVHAPSPRRQVPVHARLRREEEEEEEGGWGDDDDQMLTSGPRRSSFTPLTAWLHPSKTSKTAEIMHVTIKKRKKDGDRPPRWRSLTMITFLREAVMSALCAELVGHLPPPPTT